MMMIRRLVDADDFIAIDGTSVREIAGRASSAAARQSLSLAVVPPAIQTSEHYHRLSEEIYLVRAGTGIVRVGEQRARLSPGCAVIIPPGSVHNLANDGEHPLEVWCFCTPPYDDDDTVAVV